MIVLDTILTAPFSGLLWIFQEIHNAVEQETAGRAEAITAQLQQLYAALEKGEISDEEFDEREAVLLDRLDEIEDQGALLD